MQGLHERNIRADEILDKTDRIQRIRLHSLSAMCSRSQVVIEQSKLILRSERCATSLPGAHIDGDYESYLVVLPGKLLADMYGLPVRV